MWVLILKLLSPRPWDFEPRRCHGVLVMRR